MAWTEEQRRLAYERRKVRRGLCYQSDMTDPEWERVRPHIPPERRGGRHRDTDMRAVVNAILYLGWSGCQWAALPHDFPPKSTVYEYFSAWVFNGTFDRILSALVRDERERSGRDASPTLMIVDAQSVKSGPNRGGKGLMPSGFDGGKTVLGAKRHAVVDVCGNLLGVLVTAANVDDRVAAAALLAMLRPLFPFVALILGDAGYTGPTMKAAVANSGTWRFEIETRSDAASGFKPTRRWTVERTFAFIGLCRRLSRNYERYAQTAEAWVKLAMARILLHRTPLAA
jgi:putative transposase